MNIEIKTPIDKVIANPLTIDCPMPYKIEAVISEETLDAQIEDQALLNPKSKAKDLLFPQRISSLIRSKINIFASTAIPTHRINPAIPANVRVIGGKINSPVLNMANTRIVYIISATSAINPKIP